MPELQYKRHSAYGLKVRSAIPLTEFSPLPSGVEDVLVTYGDKAVLASVARENPAAIEITESEARFWFPGVGVFIIRGGKSITVVPEPGVPTTLLRLYIQGMMMGMILHQRGACVLHSSVIAYQGSAIALLGHVGVGKSSLAAALYRRNYRVIADDNGAISFSSGRLMIVPSYPYVKVFPEIAQTLGFRKKDLRPLDGSQLKKAGRVVNGFSEEPIPLSRIYVLGREFDEEVKRLSGLQATLELIRNSIPTRWGHKGDAGQLQRCAAVARQVPVFTLKTFTELAGIESAVDRLEAHLNGNTAASQAQTVSAGVSLSAES
jgi:hypothetical protein